MKTNMMIQTKSDDDYRNENDKRAPLLLLVIIYLDLQPGFLVPTITFFYFIYQLHNHIHIFEYDAVDNNAIEFRTMHI